MGKKFEDLTRGQQAALRVEGRRLVTRMFFNGVNFGGLIFVSNLLLILANLVFFSSNIFLYASCIVADILLLNMMLSSIDRSAKSFKEKVDKILNAE